VFFLKIIKKIFLKKRLDNKKNKMYKKNNNSNNLIQIQIMKVLEIGKNF